MYTCILTQEVSVLLYGAKTLTLPVFANRGGYNPLLAGVLRLCDGWVVIM